MNATNVLFQLNDNIFEDDEELLLTYMQNDVDPFTVSCTVLTTGKLPSVRAVQQGTLDGLQKRWEFPLVTGVHNALQLS